MEERRKKSSLVTILLFLAVIFGVLMLCIISEDKGFSQKENRRLQGIPDISLESITDGSFTKDFEKYASDNIVGRDLWVSVKSTADLMLGKKDNGRAYFGKEGYFFPIETIDFGQLEKNLGYVEAFMQHQLMNNRNLRFSVIGAPTSTEIMKMYLPKNAPVPDEEQAALRMKEVLGDSVSDVLPILRSRNKEYIYYRTDHHWTSLGAYYAYTEWAKGYGLEPMPIEQYEIEKVTDQFYGTTYSKAGIMTKPDIVEKFVPKGNGGTASYRMTVDTGKEKRVYNGTLYEPKYLSEKDKYSYFLAGNNRLTVIEKTGKYQGTGKRLLLIKDSYAHCFVPFLQSHFDRIIAVDLRYYRQSPDELIEEYGITDVMFLYDIIQFSNDKNFVYL